MNRWSESLLKFRVDLEAIGIPDSSNPDESNCIREMCGMVEGEHTTKERLAAARKRLAHSLARGPKTSKVRAVAAALRAELDEIEADLAFQSSRRGRFILFVNDWAQGLAAARAKLPECRGISLGSSPDAEIVVAAGRVARTRDLVRFAELLAAHPPGVPVEYRVLVESGA